MNTPAPKNKRTKRIQEHRKNLVTIIYNIIYIIIYIGANTRVITKLTKVINYNFFLHFGTPTTEVGVVRLSNSAASKAAVGTTERELLRETLTIPSPTLEEEDEALFTLFTLLTLHWHQSYYY